MKPECPQKVGIAVETVRCDASTASVAARFACRREPAILESSAPSDTYGRFSLFAADPIDTFVLDSVAMDCPFRMLARHVETLTPPAEPVAGVPFCGAWIGYIAYEAGLSIEGIPAAADRDLPLPQLRFSLYDSAALYDHQSGEWRVVAVDWPKYFAKQNESTAVRLKRLRDNLINASRGDSPLPAGAISSTPTPNMSVGAYLDQVATAKRYIESGDIYQVNLTQRFTAQTDATPEALYRRLRRVNPSSHAALLRWNDVAVLSSSPELFLRLHDGKVTTCPIKGTNPRGTDQASDASARRELANSAKDKAELDMIIDLLRNDLGRVCEYGSIVVSDAGRIETHPTVFHRAATIVGRLRSGQTWVDLLRATLPGGSITGAPKIRAMQIIAELEPTQRSVYCGSIGMIGLDGSLQTSVAIRTMIQVADTVHVFAGGAIVADSDPHDEYREILAKASGMFRTLCCGNPATAMPEMELSQV